MEKIGQSKVIPKLMEIYTNTKDKTMKNYTKAALRSIVHGGTS